MSKSVGYWSWIAFHEQNDRRVDCAFKINYRFLAPYHFHAKRQAEWTNQTSCRILRNTSNTSNVIYVIQWIYLRGLTCLSYKNKFRLESYTFCLTIYIKFAHQDLEILIFVYLWFKSRCKLTLGLEIEGVFSLLHNIQQMEFGIEYQWECAIEH